MVYKADFYTLISEKIATPLTMASEEFAMRSEQPTKTEDLAQQIAMMLSKITALSIKAMGKLDVKEHSENDGDALRLGLAGVVTPMVANHYRIKGQMPADEEIEKFATAIETVAKFGDNFQLPTESTLKLKTIEGVTVKGDENFVQLQYLQIFAPIMASIQTFSFGMPEHKMLQEVADKLVKRSRELSQEFFPDIEKEKETFARLSILRSLAMLFTQSYMGQMAKMMASQGQSGELPNITLEDVWKQFDKTSAMINTLAAGFFSTESIVSAESEPEKADSAPTKEETPVVAKVPEPEGETGVEEKDSKIDSAKAMEKVPETTAEPVKEEPEEKVKPEEKVEKDEETQGDSGDPMSFFVKS